MEVWQNLFDAVALAFHHQELKHRPPAAGDPAGYRRLRLVERRCLGRVRKEPRTERDSEGLEVITCTNQPFTASIPAPRRGLRGKELLGYGVRTLRNGERAVRPDRSGAQDRDWSHRRPPAAGGGNRGAAHASGQRAAILPVAQELRERAKELHLQVLEHRPEVREAVVQNPRATKIDVAEALVRNGFDQLNGLVPKRPARAALRPRDKSGLHMFDALELAEAAAHA